MQDGGQFTTIPAISSDYNNEKDGISKGGDELISYYT